MDSTFYKKNWRQMPSHRNDLYLAGQIGYVSCFQRGVNVGTSTVAYQQQLRIARAKELLAQNPTLSQRRLAQACGFGSARDFRRMWKKQ